MIVILSARVLYARVFSQALSEFLNFEVKEFTFEQVIDIDACLIVIDGHGLHSQTLSKIIRNNKNASFILISDTPYSSFEVIDSVLSVVPTHTTYRDICKLCQMALGIRMSKVNQEACSRFSSIEENMILALKRGASNKEIARKYKIPLSRVKYHLQKIYTKLGVRNRTQAALKAD